MTNEIPFLLDSFVDKAKEEFKYVGEFGFKFSNIEISNVWATVTYKKEEVLLNVTYSVLDQFIDVEFRNLPDAINFDIINSEKKLPLTVLVRSLKKNLKVFDELEVRDGKFVIPLIRAAKLLREYGFEILSKRN